MTGVLSLMRGTDSGGNHVRGFVAHFTECCAPMIMFTTLTLTVLPPLVARRPFDA